MPDPRPGDASLGPARFEQGARRWTGAVLGALVLGACLWTIQYVQALGPRWDEVYRDRLLSDRQSVEHQAARLYEGWGASMAYVVAGACGAMCLSRSYGLRFFAVVLAAAGTVALVCAAGSTYTAEWERQSEETVAGGFSDRVRFGLNPAGGE